MADQIVTSRLAAIRAADMVGDSRFPVFPSVVDTLRCIIEVQRSMRERNAGVTEDKRIEFRIGINVGDVMPEGEDLLGDGVTLAARIQGLAEPGGICLSGTARDQVRDRLALELAGLVLWLGQCAVSRNRENYELEPVSTTDFKLVIPCRRCARGRHDELALTLDDYR